MLNLSSKKVKKLLKPSEMKHIMGGDGDNSGFGKSTWNWNWSASQVTGGFDPCRNWAWNPNYTPDNPPVTKSADKILDALSTLAEMITPDGEAKEALKNAKPKK